VAYQQSNKIIFIEKFANPSSHFMNDLVLNIYSRLLTRQNNLEIILYSRIRRSLVDLEPPCYEVPNFMLSIFLLRGIV
jgi:hypothetical protein